MADKVIRPIRIEGNVAYVPLTRGYEAIIDAIDVPLAALGPWSARVVKRSNGALMTVYAHRTGAKKRTMLLHREILEAPPGWEVDHVSGDGLDNRRENLRLVTRQQNMHNQRLRANNRSGVKGVHWNKRLSKWRADIAVDGANVYLGLFATLEEAADAYARASAELHGEYGRTT